MEQRQIKQYFVDKENPAENKFNSNFKQKTLFVILLLLKYKTKDLVSLWIYF